MTVYNGDCGDNATWTHDTDTGVLRISGTGAMTDYAGTYSAPWYDHKGTITQIVIDSGITRIGNYTFTALTSALTSVNIPDSVTSIGNYAFGTCLKLTSVNIPDSVTSIEYGAFSGCTALASIILPDSVTSLGEHVFNGCTALASVRISRSVTSLGTNVFYGCSSLTSVEIPSSVTSIGEKAFYGCSSLTSITFKGDQPDSLGNQSFRLYGNGSTTVYATVYSKGWASDDVFTSTVRYALTKFTYVVLTGSTVHVNVGGTWKEATPYVNVGGTWKEVTSVHVNVNGTWKEVS